MNKSYLSEVTENFETIQRLHELKVVIATDS